MKRLLNELSRDFEVDKHKSITPSAKVSGSSTGRQSGLSSIPESQSISHTEHVGTLTKTKESESMGKPSSTEEKLEAAKQQKSGTGPFWGQGSGVSDAQQQLTQGQMPHEELCDIAEPSCPPAHEEEQKSHSIFGQVKKKVVETLKGGRRRSTEELIAEGSTHGPTVLTGGYSGMEHGHYAAESDVH